MASVRRCRRRRGRRCFVSCVLSEFFHSLVLLLLFSFLTRALSVRAFKQVVVAGLRATRDGRCSWADSGK